jgi:hypothetical protein
MTAEALQTILDLQKKVVEYERFHLDLLFLLHKGKKVGYECTIPEIDHTESEIYNRVKDLVKKGKGKEK